MLNKKNAKSIKKALVATKWAIPQAPFSTKEVVLSS